MGESVDSRVGCAHVSTGSGLSSWLVSISLLSFPQKLYSEKCDLAWKPGGVLLPGLLSAACSAYLGPYTSQGLLLKGGACSVDWALPLTSLLMKKMPPQTWPTDQSDGGIFLSFTSSSLMTTVCIKMTKANQHSEVREVLRSLVCHF